MPKGCDLTPLNSAILHRNLPLDHWNRTASWNHKTKEKQQCPAHKTHLWTNRTSCSVTPSLSHTHTSLGTTKKHRSLCSNWNNLWHFAMRRSCATQNPSQNSFFFYLPELCWFSNHGRPQRLLKNISCSEMISCEFQPLHLLFSLWYFLPWRESQKFRFKSYQNNLTKIPKNGLHLSRRKTSTTRWTLNSKILCYTNYPGQLCKKTRHLERKNPTKQKRHK